jgi:uncharacterized protein (TIGR03435 family)
MRKLALIGVLTTLSGTLLGQSTNKPAAFEIADVHVSPPTVQASVSGGIPRNGRYELRNASMVDLITKAYDVSDDKIAGGPSWLATDRFDVIAKLPSATATPEEARLMLQNLLAERFGLKVHNDSKPLPAYVLSMGKGAPKMKKSDGSSSGCQPQPGGEPQPGVIPYQQVSCHNMTSEQIAQNLRQLAPAYLNDHPVVDQTKLEGTWDFDIKWTGRGQLAAAGADGISIFDAVDKQLGLKLELQQVVMPAVVVDSVNRKPTDNLPGVAEKLPPEKPEFEAVDIKPSPPGTNNGPRVNYTQGGRITAEGTLRDLIAAANQVMPNLAADFVVGPKFMETSRFTIIAKTPATGIGAVTRNNGQEAPPPIGVALMMLRAALEDRFKLKYHNEDRPATVYALSAKGESKMKKADASERANCKPDPGAVPASFSGTPMNAITCQNTTMAELITNLPQWAGAYIDHPVVDTTGLQGGWNFTLMWTPRQALENRPAPAAGAPNDSASLPGGISVFEAVEKQLGLKLEKTTKPMPVMVIDHAEEKPVD